jgi:uncharacterized protein (DUF2267 family)
MAAAHRKGSGMHYEDFIAHVAQYADLSEQEAATLTRATLATFAERITGGEAHGLAAQLPARIKPALISAHEHAEAFSVKEFVDRTAERAGTDPDVAEVAIRAVLGSLRDAVAPAEFDDAVSQLPAAFHRLARLPAPLIHHPIPRVGP